MSGGYRPPYRERDSHRDRDRDRERPWERDRDWGRDRPRGDSRRDRDREWEDGGERRDSRLGESRRRFDAHTGLDRPLDGGYDRDRDRDWPLDRRGPPSSRDFDRRDPFPPRDARRDDRDDGRAPRSYQDSDRYSGPPRGPRNGRRPSRSRSPPSRREGSPRRFKDVPLASSSGRWRSVSPSSQSSSSRRQPSMNRRPSPAPLAVERARRPRSPPESGEEMTDSPLPTRTPSSATSAVSGTLSIRGAAMTAAASTSRADATAGTSNVSGADGKAFSPTAIRQSDQRNSAQIPHEAPKAMLSRDASGGAERNSSMPASAATPSSEWSSWQAGPTVKPDTAALGDIRPPTGPRAMQQQAQRTGIASSQGRQYGDRQGAFRRESSPTYRSDRLSVSQQPSRSSSAQGEETGQAQANDGFTNQARPFSSSARDSSATSSRTERGEGRPAWREARSNAPPVHAKFDSSRDSPLEKGGDWGESSPSAHTARHEDDEAWGQSPSTSTRPDYRVSHDGRGRPNTRGRGSHAPRGGPRGGPTRGGYGRDYRHSSYRGDIGPEGTSGPGGGEVKKAQPTSITHAEDAESAALRRARWTTLDEAYLNAAAETRKALRELDVLYGELAAANLNRVLRQQHLNTYKDTFSLGFTGTSSGDAPVI